MNWKLEIGIGIGIGIGIYGDIESHHVSDPRTDFFLVFASSRPVTARPLAPAPIKRAP